MIPAIIIAAVLLLIALILSVWITLGIEYTDSAACYLKILFFKINLLEIGEKQKKEKKKKKKKKKKSTAAQVPPKKSTAVKKEEENLPLREVLGIAKSVLPKFCGKLHFCPSFIRLYIGSGDAAKTAMLCGAAKASSSMLFEFIDRWCIIDGNPCGDVIIEPDFTSCQIKCQIKLRFRMRVISILSVGAAFVIKLIKTKINEEKKGKRP